MTDTLSAHLAARFEEDARALRARALALASAPKGAKQAGPNAASCEAMAGACDRVRTLFISAADDVALAQLGPELERLRDAEPSGDARHVYAGAVERLRKAIDASLDDEDDDDDDEDDGDDDDD